jgi:FKBP-type peptidyl-prolyl cis-trans isomerase FkpA
MKNIKAYLILIPFSLVLLFSSCLTEEEKIERTYAMEMEELEEILSGIEKEGYDIDTTDLGVYYVVMEEGDPNGITPAEGDTITIEYIGYYTDGSIFDASKDHFPDGKWTFKYMDEEIGLISGMTDGLSIMTAGAKHDMILTSNLAYGATGQGMVPGYTTLIFTVTLHDIKPLQE